MNRYKRRSGFSLLEVIVAIFVFLVGVMGVLMTFTAGMRARMVAQELIVSQDLAQKWYEWVRFRMNEHPGAGAPVGTLTRGDLTAGKGGDFYENSGDLCLSPANHANNMPTYQCSVYRGYRWSITAVDSAYQPQWEASDGTMRSWTQTAGGTSVVPGAVGAAPDNLTRVELSISRGTRQYRYHFIFSGVGRKYDPL